MRGKEPMVQNGHGKTAAAAQPMPAVHWFTRLEEARARGAWGEAAEALGRLEDLGIRVTYLLAKEVGR